MDSSALLTEREAAERLLAQPCTLTKWRHRGRGPAFLKLSGKIRYSLADIQAFIEASRRVPGERTRKKSRAIPPAPQSKQRRRASAA
jgi:predicted site-specific integrase-resolvase